METNGSRSLGTEGTLPTPSLRLLFTDGNVLLRLSLGLFSRFISYGRKRVHRPIRSFDIMANRRALDANRPPNDENKEKSFPRERRERKLARGNYREEEETELSRVVAAR